MVVCCVGVVVCVCYLGFWVFVVSGCFIVLYLGVSGGKTGETDLVKTDLGRGVLWGNRGAIQEFPFKNGQIRQNLWWDWFSEGWCRIICGFFVFCFAVVILFLVWFFDFCRIMSAR